MEPPVVSQPNSQLQPSTPNSPHLPQSPVDTSIKKRAPNWLKLLILASLLFFIMVVVTLVFAVKMAAGYMQNLPTTMSGKDFATDYFKDPLNKNKSTESTQTSDFDAAETNASFMFPLSDEEGTDESILNYMGQFKTAYLQGCAANNIDTELCTCTYDYLVDQVGEQGLIDIALGMVGKDPTDVNALPKEVLEAANQCLNKSSY